MGEPKSPLPVVAEDGRRAFPRREKQPVAPELDANGDVIFRFSVDTPPAIADLEAFYREAILDLLRVVRLYSGDRALIIDGFAFLNAPRAVLPLVPRPADGGAGPVG